MPAKVIERDNGYRRVMRNINSSRMGRRLKIGVSADELTENVAAIHEFGLGVPERSFVRSWFDENRARILLDLKRVTEEVIRGDDISRQQKLEELGKKYVAEVQQRILRHINPDLEPETIKEKTRADLPSPETPLVATGHMLNSIVAILDGRIIS